MEEIKILELKKLLDAINTYLYKDDHEFHFMPKISYCPSCDSIVRVGGSYWRFDGYDCGGASHSLQKAEENCCSCHSTKFIDIGKYNLHMINKSPYEIIKIINRTQDNLEFPSLYCEELPAVWKSWKKLTKKDKVNQINSLMNLTKRKELLEKILRE